MPIYKKTVIRFRRPLVLTALIMAGFVASTRAQEVSIPDPGLNVASRQALNNPVGPLIAQDMLGLTNLDARSRSIRRVDGLAAARNLSQLFLDFNSLTNLDLPNTLTNLDLLTLGLNPLTRCSIPSGLTNLAVVFLQFNQLTNLTLSPHLINLIQIDLRGNQLTRLTLPPDATKLSTLGLDGNPLMNFVLSETSAATQLAFTVVTLQNQGVAVFTYPLAVRLLSLRRPRLHGFPGLERGWRCHQLTR